MNFEYIDELVEKVENIRGVLKDILDDHNIPYMDTKLSTLLESFKQLRTIKPNRRYIAVELNELGYIKNLIETDIIADPMPIPEDILRGYYKVVDGKIVLDEARKSILWEG